MTNSLTKPITGIENRTAQEVFDIMCDRFRSAEVSIRREGAEAGAVALEEIGKMLIEAAIELRSGEPFLASKIGVKPLQWVKPFGSDRLEKADTILGVYQTWTHFEAGGRWFWQLSAPVSSFRIVEGEGGSEAEVRRAAEVDYETRIRSALE